MDLQLTGKRAVVTGGSRGIGKAVAASLATEGCDVVIGARDRERLDAAADELSTQTGRHVVGVVVDTASDESVDRFRDEAVAALGGVDILVNSAAQPGGQSRPPRLAEITDEMFWDDVNVKVLGYLRGARAFAPGMAAAGWGRIVNISGLAARVTGSTIGSMRNVAVAAMTKNLADELAPAGINVTVVHPGVTRTEATPAVLARVAEARGLTIEEAEAAFARNSIGRLVDASEVADVVTFLASPRSVAINGDAIACGGGVPGSIHY